MSYLIVKGKGGMGNRMLCAATGILYGQLADRNVWVDWRDHTYSDDGRNVFPLYFDTDLVKEIPRFDNETIFPKIWQGNLQQSAHWMIEKYYRSKHSSLFIENKISIDTSKLDYSETVVVLWSYTEKIRKMKKIIKKSTQNYFFESKEQILRQIFTQKMPISDHIKRNISSFKSKYWREKVIGVHIRYTDRKINIDKYQKPLKYFLEKYPSAYIFLCTDNKQILKYFEEEYDRLFWLEKWYPEDNKTMHQNDKCPNRYHNGIEALMDMYLLAECDVLIYAGHSTFSWISKILSNAPSDHKVDILARNPTVQLKKIIRNLF
jgi:hypothetical protein